MSSQEELSEGELKKKAYLMGLRLKNAGLDAETIYARLEKQGIPEDLARKVAEDIVIENKRRVVKDTEPLYHLALVRVVIGVLAAIISYLVYPENFVFPIGFIAIGIFSALWARRKMEE